MRTLVVDEAHRVGWNSETEEDELGNKLRSLLFGVAGLAGDPEIVRAAFTMFGELTRGDKQVISPNFRLCVYQIVLKFGGVIEVGLTAQLQIDTMLTLTWLVRCRSRTVAHR